MHLLSPEGSTGAADTAPFNSAEKFEEPSDSTASANNYITFTKHCQENTHRAEEPGKQEFSGCSSQVVQSGYTKIVRLVLDVLTNAFLPNQ